MYLFSLKKINLCAIKKTTNEINGGLKL